MTFVGLDLNSRRALAVSGPAGAAPRELPLDGQHDELPMAVSLQNRHPEAGRAGAAISRRLPHLVCLNFLPYLDDGRQWCGGRHRLDAERALTLVFERLQPALAGAEGFAVALPSYVGPAQREHFAQLMEKLASRRRSKMPRLLATTGAPLAAAHTAAAEHHLPNLVLLGDADDQTFCWSAVRLIGHETAVVAEQSAAHLSLRAWKARLLDAVADRCIRQSRRDPRECGATEQDLHEQLERALAGSQQGQLVELAIQGERWYQNLILRPEDFVDFCNVPVRQAVEVAQNLALTAVRDEPIRDVLLTAAAARLPGLAAALEAEGMRVAGLPADAIARGAHEAAVRVHRGDLPAGHLASLPVAAGEPAAGTAYQRVISIRAVER